MKSLKRLKFCAFVCMCALIFLTANAQNLEKDIDAIVSSMYTAQDPGISILVSKKGKPIYRKAFGKANLELGVPLQLAYKRKNNYDSSFIKSYFWDQKLYGIG